MIRFLIVSATLLFTLAHCATPKSATAVGEAAALLPDRTLLWSDEFNGTTLDTSSWNFALGDGCPKLCGWGNNERQLYTRNNHRLEDGKLVITVRKEGDTYTSTRINTKYKRSFCYGRVEARAKLPRGQGLWPAFWMLGDRIDQVGWPRCGEIDIMEYVGRRPEEIFTTVHTRAGSGGSGTSGRLAFPDIEADFHTYAIEWTQDKIDFFLDDQLINTYQPAEKTAANWPFDEPFFILFNLAVGGNFGGKEIDDSVFPQEFIIDYVRVYGEK